MGVKGRRNILDDYDEAVYAEIRFTYIELGMELEWTMREGDTIKIKDMNDSHIQKCLNMMRRKELNGNRKGWISVFEDVQIVRRKEKIDKLKNEIRRKVKS